MIVTSVAEERYASLVGLRLPLLLLVPNDSKSARRGTSLGALTLVLTYDEAARYPNVVGLCDGLRKRGGAWIRYASLPNSLRDLTSVEWRRVPTETHERFLGRGFTVFVEGRDDGDGDDGAPGAATGASGATDSGRARSRVHGARGAADEAAPSAAGRDRAQATARSFAVSYEWDDATRVYARSMLRPSDVPDPRSE